MGNFFGFHLARSLESMRGGFWVQSLMWVGERGKKIDAVRISRTIALSVLLLATVIGGALAQERIVSRLYGTGNEAIRKADARPAAGVRIRTKDMRRTSDLSPVQWVEVVRVVEGLLAGAGPPWRPRRRLRRSDARSAFGHSGAGAG